MAPIYDCMSVILPQEVWCEWLASEGNDRTALQYLLRSAPADLLECWTVTDYVNNDEIALALMDDLKDDRDWQPVTNTLKKRIAATHMSRRIDGLESYLKEVGSPHAVDRSLSFVDNIKRLMRSDPMYGEGKAIALADLLVALRCNEEIASALRTWDWRGEYFLNISPEVATVVMVRLAEDKARKEDFQRLFELFRKVFYKAAGDVRWRYSALLLASEPGADWVQKCYPDHPAFKNLTTPGTVEHMVANAPVEIRDFFLSQSLMYLSEQRVTRRYNPEEARSFFADFVPSHPFLGGFIYVAEHRNKPAAVGLKEPSEREFEYNADNLTGNIVKGTTGQGHAAGIPYADAFMQKPNANEKAFVAVSNPENARLMIFETHDYEYIGKYTMTTNDRPTGAIVDVYRPKLSLQVVDLLTRKTLLKEEKTMPVQDQYRLDQRWVWAGNVYCPSLFFDRGEFLREKIDLHGLE